METLSPSLLAEFREWRKQKLREEQLPKKSPFLMDMKVWRWSGERGSGLKGGIGLRIRCPEIEDVMERLSNGKYEVPNRLLGGANVDRIKVYKPPSADAFLAAWPSSEAIVHDGVKYFPSMHPGTLPVDVSYNRVSLAPLAAVGLSKGVTIRAEGLYTESMLNSYAAVLPVIIKKFFRTYIKKSEVYAYVTEKPIVGGRGTELAA